jgi:TetR/AcrR family transcriptional regulator
MAARKSTRSAEGPGRPLADPDRDTRALLLDAATQLFSELGVAATNFSMIARRAKVTPAMVHYYFDDREQLIDAVVDERLLPILGYVWDEVEAGDDPAELISGVVARLLERVERAPWVPSTWMREILNEGGLLRGRMLQRLPVDKVRMLGLSIARAQAAGTANTDLDPLLVVFSTIGLVMVHMATRNTWSDIFQRPPLGAEEMQKHITGLLLHGLDPVPPPPHDKPGPSKPPIRSKR